MDKNFGEKLKKLRKEKNISQYELAKKIGTTQKSVSEWETNKVLPHTKFILRIKEFLKFNVDEILKETISEESEVANEVEKID